jgi:hypothetical protein
MTVFSTNLKSERPSHARHWAADREEAQQIFRIAEEKFRPELAKIGAGIVGPNACVQEQLRAAMAGPCSCGSCVQYPRCTFTAPRHVGDVFANLYATGSKSAAYVARAAAAAETWPNFEAVVSLGIGAGACLTGLAIADRLPERKFGVEVEPKALRVLPAVVSDVVVEDDIRKILLPAGPILVVASLVWNLPVPAGLWAEEIARDRDEFWVLSVTRPRDFKNKNCRGHWENLGFESSWPYDWRLNRTGCWGLDGDSGGYGIELDRWVRA